MMKLMWLCNMMPGAVQTQLGRKNGGGLWLDHVLADMLQQDITLLILCPGPGNGRGTLSPSCSWKTFSAGLPYQLLPEQKQFFAEAIQSFGPDVIHVWGTEFGHTLNMMEACRDLNMLDRTVISIQGLCSIYAGHFCEGLPVSVQRGNTFRDLIRRDNLRQQQKKFVLRGENEKKALSFSRHVIGRTHWDRACTRLLAPEARYHFCNETLRQPFYEKKWEYELCEKHRIFASSRLYPIKGFHYLLEAFAVISRRYPDAVLAVPGQSPLGCGWKDRLREDSYSRYLRKLLVRNHLEDRVEFLGHLSSEEMLEQYLKANVFVLPSTIENSPNSMGEAMLLGTPVAAADVGGVTTMLEPGREGLVYQGTASYMLADCIQRIFDMGPEARTLGEKARGHALKTHDPAANLETLLRIYQEIGG